MEATYEPAPGRLTLAVESIDQTPDSTRSSTHWPPRAQPRGGRKQLDGDRKDRVLVERLLGAAADLSVATPIRDQV